MNYVYNKADVQRAFIFVQTEMFGFIKWIKTIYENSTSASGALKILCTKTAKEYAEEIKAQLEDKEALGIVEFEVFTDLSREETIETFRKIKVDSIKYTEENNCTLGLVFCTIGFAGF